MTYAIIGSGAIGRALATQFARKGIEVQIANRRGAASLHELVDAFGPSIKPVSVEQALDADVVILAVPFEAVADVAASAARRDGRIVVDATNAIAFPAFTPLDLDGRLSSDVIADLLPDARLVKGFNTLPAAVLAAEPEQPIGRRVVFLSGNHPEANREVGALAHRLGFTAIDLGRLDEGGRLQQFGGALMVHALVKQA